MATEPSPTLRAGPPAAAALLALAAACTGTADLETVPLCLDPPATRTAEAEDAFHGRRVRDPYRWLEATEAPEVQRWLELQNAHTEDCLSRSDVRPALRERLQAIWTHAHFGTPSRHGERWFFTESDGLEEHAVLRVADAPDAAGSVLLDPNALADDGAVALAANAPSPEGDHVAYALSTPGSGALTWRVIETSSGEHLDDVLERAGATRPAWTRDGLGFFYQRDPPPRTGDVVEAAPQLCYHALGTVQADDIVVYERPDRPSWSYGVEVTHDGLFAVVTVAEGADPRNRVGYINLAEIVAGVRPLLMAFDASYEFAGADGKRFFFVTDLDAPLGRLLAMDLDRPEPEHWVEVVPEAHDTLESVELFGGQLVAVYLHDACHRLARFALDGEPLAEIALPELSAADDLAGRPDDALMYFALSGFTRPREIWSLDLETDELTLLREPRVAFDPQLFEVRQAAFHARDGTRLLLFVLHRRDLVLDGSSPTYLCGDGGFGVSMTPRFSVPALVWVERGGVYAQAVLRGGGEFGSAWHESGRLDAKQHVFYDFVACARYLLRNDFTSSDKLAIGGRGNGGLTVAATLNQRPELFGAAVIEAGVLDMLRYQLLGSGWAWIPEYGNSDDREAYRVLRAYSPLHNVRDDVRYPPVLVLAAAHDDRVAPAHSYKFAAALQDAQPDVPVLLRVRGDAGHRDREPMAARIEAAADRLAFLRMALGTE